jgi:hypothetical protein
MARRFRTLTNRVNRLAAEIRSDQNAVGTAGASGSSHAEIVGQAQEHLARLINEYNSRIAPQLGMLVEDARDAGYQLPRAINCHPKLFPLLEWE